MKIVVGLGNPGREYAATRHNVGFMVVDQFARRIGASGTKKRFRSEIVEGTFNGEKVVLVAPQTYMNLSGHAVREVVNWYHVPREDLIVIADDLDLPFGALRLRARGSAGGHNGLSSIFQELGSQEIARLKVGIGRGPGVVTARVLSRFSPDEEANLPEIIDRAIAGIEQWTREGIIAAMNDLNRKGETATSADAGNRPTREATNG